MPAGYATFVSRYLFSIERGAGFIRITGRIDKIVQHEPCADAMRVLLRDMYAYVHREKDQGKTKSSYPARMRWITRYRAPLDEGYAAQPPPSIQRGKRGRIKRTKAHNLLDRLTRYERSVLAFLYDYSVPFTNQYL